MQAIVNSTYGPPEQLQRQEIAKPTPKDNEVVVKVHTVSLNAADVHLLTADIPLVRLMSGLLKPKFQVLGAAVAGRVEAVGKDATRFRPGDAVVGDVSGAGFGGLAEYVCAPEDAFAPKPASLSFAASVTAPVAATTALQGLRDKGGLQAGQKALISGASGGVGTFAVQIAKALGAEVTAVCSTRNLDMVRALGADHVIDYTREDFTRNGQQYDLILAVNGYHPLGDYQRALTPSGRYVMVGGTGRQMFDALALGPLASRRNGHRVVALSAKANHEDLTYVLDLMAAGKITPVIDRIYPLDQAADAFRYLIQERARGKIVITVDQGDAGYEEV